MNTDQLIKLIQEYIDANGMTIHGVSGKLLYSDALIEYLMNCGLKKQR
jgi:hypothetical protein